MTIKFIHIKPELKFWQALSYQWIWVIYHLVIKCSFSFFEENRDSLINCVADDWRVCYIFHVRSHSERITLLIINKYPYVLRVNQNYIFIAVFIFYIIRNTMYSLTSVAVVRLVSSSIQKILCNNFQVKSFTEFCCAYYWNLLPIQDCERSILFSLRIKFSLYNSN